MSDPEADRSRMAREALYADACARPSDINEHLSKLRELASQCKHVTEFGTRGGVSTIALLAAQPDYLVTWDIDPSATAGAFNRFLAVRGLVGKTYFQPRVGNTLFARIERTDMLFIDTLHTYRQLAQELSLHAWRVRKYLAFHDTVTFGSRGEDGHTPGLRQAIDEFVFKEWTQKNRWEPIVDAKNNNGLVVLQCLERYTEEVVT